jgi:hypothetical protein
VTEVIIRRGAPVFRSLAVVAFIGVWINTQAAETVVIVGVGTVGPWDTAIDLVNTGDATMRAQISPDFSDFASGLPGGAVVADAQIPAHGSARVMASEIPARVEGRLYTVFVSSDSEELPIVKARELGPDGIGADLPILKLSTLIGASPPVLTFPDVTRSTATRTAIVVGAITGQNGGLTPLTVLVELFDAEGGLVSSGSFDNSGTDPQFANIFLPDVLPLLGVETIESGVLRVTKIEGHGALWGESVIVGPRCNFSTTPGFNP